MKSVTTLIRRGVGRAGRRVSCLYDTGSEDGLIRAGAAGATSTAELPDPVSVMGIGGGAAVSRRVALFQLRLLGRWCRYSALVVPNDALDVDLLVGEDFLNRYGLSVDVRRNRLDVAYPEHFQRMTRRKIFVGSSRGAVPRRR